MLLTQKRPVIGRGRMRRWPAAAARKCWRRLHRTNRSYGLRNAAPTHQLQAPETRAQDDSPFRPLLPHQSAPRQRTTTHNNKAEWPKVTDAAPGGTYLRLLRAAVSGFEDTGTHFTRLRFGSELRIRGQVSARSDMARRG